jgi:hypothetical protein
MDEVPDIPGADDVVKWFGYWPTFHDAQILSITLNRSGEAARTAASQQSGCERAN